MCFCLEFLKYSKKEIDAFLFLHAQKLLGIQLHKANLESSYCILLVFQTRKYEHHQVLKIMVKHSSFSYREPTWIPSSRKSKTGVNNGLLAWRKMHFSLEPVNNEFEMVRSHFPSIGHLLLTKKGF